MNSKDDRYFTKEHEELVRAYRASSKAERDRIFTELYPVLVRTFEGLIKRKKVTFHRDPTEDVMQECMLMISRSLPAFDARRGTAFTFITKCMWHAILRFVRPTAEKRHNMSTYVTNGAQTGYVKATALRDLERAELLQDLACDVAWAPSQMIADLAEETGVSKRVVVEVLQTLDIEVRLR